MKNLLIGILFFILLLNAIALFYTLNLKKTDFNDTIWKFDSQRYVNNINFVNTYSMDTVTGIVKNVEFYENGDLKTLLIADELKNYNENIEFTLTEEASRELGNTEAQKIKLESTVFIEHGFSIETGKQVVKTLKVISSNI